MIRTAFTMLVFGTFTIICGRMGLVGALLHLRDGAGVGGGGARRSGGTTATWASGVEVEEGTKICRRERGGSCVDRRRFHFP